MEMALLTGQRQGDIIAMKSSQVQEIGIVVEQSKTGKKLAIEITPALEAVLDKCWKIKGGGESGSEYVLPTRTGKPYTSEGFRACWQRTINRWQNFWAASGSHFTICVQRALRTARPLTPPINASGTRACR